MLRSIRDFISLPYNRCFAMLLQVLVGSAEVMIAEETLVCR